MNSVQAKTQIEENLDSRNDLLSRTANIVARFVLDNCNTRDSVDMEADLKKITKGYSDAELNIIYVKAIAIVGAYTAQSKPRKSGKSSGGGFSSGADFLKGKRGGY